MILFNAVRLINNGLSQKQLKYLGHAIHGLGAIISSKMAMAMINTNSSLMAFVNHSAND